MNSSHGDELEKPKVLIVDDSSMGMVQVQALLTQLDLTLFEATNAEEALSLVPKHEFALVILRQKMKVPGSDIIKQIQTKPETANLSTMLLLKADDWLEAWPFDLNTGLVCFADLPLAEDRFLSKVQVFLKLHFYRRAWEKEIMKRKNLEEKVRHTGALPETGAFIANRKYFQHQFLVEWRRMLREYKPFTLIMIDIDFFEGFRERYGAQSTDQMVLKVGNAIKSAISRVSDFVARLEKGGFVVVLPNTDLDGSKKISKKIKHCVGLLELENQAAIDGNTVTISLGVANVVTSPHIQPKQFIDLADQALYRAKKRGGNQIEIIQQK